MEQRQLTPLNMPNGKHEGASPLISVITATKNVESTIVALCGSLAMQSYKNFEWLVFDGLSSDSTVELLTDLANERSWIRFSSESDFGIYHAINKALQIAKGNYYVVAGADDIFDEHALANYAECVKKVDCDVVLARVMRRGRRIGGHYPQKSWIGHSKVFAGSHSVGMLFNRRLHERFGLYSQRFPLLADGYFLKLICRSESVKVVDAEFLAGTFSEGGLSTTNELQVLAETWQIQMLTERWPLFQMFLFFGKFLVRYRRVRRELRRVRASWRERLR